MKNAQYPINVLSLFEAVSVIGPLRPLIAYGAFQRTRNAGQAGFAHTVVTTCRSESLKTSGARDLEQAVHGVGMSLRRIGERFPFDVGVLPALYRSIEELRPSIVETHNFKSHLLFFLLRCFSRKFRRIPWIAFHHGYTLTSMRVRIYQLLDWVTLRNADHVVTFCQPFARQVQAVGVAADRVTVIANTFTERLPPDSASVAAIRQHMGVRPDEKVLLCVGRLSTEKGQRYLLQAARLLAKEGGVPPVRVALVGDGPDLDTLRREFQDLRDKTVEVGYQSDPWPYYFAADIVVIPSLSEGSPLVLFESMAAGAAIVATRVGGIPEVVENEISAKLVPAGDAAKLAQALGELLRDSTRARALANNAKTTSIQYSPERYDARLAEIYNHVMSRAHRAEFA